MARTDIARLKEKLAKIDPDKAAVAIFEPGSGVVFHIPDIFIDDVKNDKPLPPYIMAVLVHIHLLRYFDSDPTVKEFVEKIKKQVLLDLLIDNDNDTA